MARLATCGIWISVCVVVLLLIVSSAQELGANPGEQFDSVEDVANRPSASDVRPNVNNRRRAGGVIKYKKMSVKSKSSGIETSSLLHSPDVVQTKSRRLKAKSSPRYTMIYKPSKKKITTSSEDSFVKLTLTTQSPKVKTDELSNSRGYSTKQWQQEEPVTETIDSFIRPTKRNRVHAHRPLEDSSTTTTASPMRVTVDPLRPISRYRSTTTTTTTSAPATTSQFIRLTRKPWRNGTTKSRDSKSESSLAEGEKFTESTSVVPEASNGPETTQQLRESPETEKQEEEIVARKAIDKPDDRKTIIDSDVPPKYILKDSSQNKPFRPRIHVTKKPVHSSDVEKSVPQLPKHQPTEEPILLQTKEQRVQQLQQDTEDTWRPEESIRFRQRIPPPSNQNSPENVEETKKRIEKYEAEKMKHLDRLRTNKNPGTDRQQPEPRRILSSNHNLPQLLTNTEPVREYDDDTTVDFIRVPPSNFGQRLPPGQSDSLSVNYPYEHSDILAELPRYVYRPDLQLNPNQVVYHNPDVVHSTTIQPNREVNRRPEIVYNTSPRPISSQDGQYQRPEVVYSTTLRPVEERRPEIVYGSTPRPNIEEETYRRPEVVYTPPKHEFQPPSAYLTEHVTYPRVSIAYYPASSKISPPSVTYEPPHLEFMPPSPPPPQRIYVPPVEEYKPPSSTAVVQVRRPEGEIPSTNYRPRLEDPRVIEGIHQLETINSYARLVSVGHPTVNELPYPPVREDQSSVTGRPAGLQQSAEPVVIRVSTEKTFSSYGQTKEQGERYKEKPLTKPGYYVPTDLAGKPYWKEETVVVGRLREPYVQRPEMQQDNERYRTGRFEGSSSLASSSYSKDEPRRNIDRPYSDRQEYNRPYPVPDPSYINTGRRVPDPPQPLTPELVHQTRLDNQPHQAYLAQESYHENQQQQNSNEPHKLYQSQLAMSDKPHVISSQERDEVDDRRHDNVIPVSEQPYQKPYGPPGKHVTNTERPLEDSDRTALYTPSEKPITVTIRPHGVPSPEPERIEFAYRPQDPSRPSNLFSTLSESRPTHQHQEIQRVNQDQQDRSKYVDQGQSYSQEQNKIPSTYHPIGPVRAYQVTQAVYSSPPNRFFHLPAPLPNPFETQFQHASSTPPPQPTQSTQQIPPSSFANSFENNHFPSGDSWSVNPILPSHYPPAISTSRPFTSTSLPLLPEEPHSSEQFVHYRPGTAFVENYRLNRSLTNFIPPSQQQPPLVYDRLVVNEETFRQQPVYQRVATNNNGPAIVKEPNYHQESIDNIDDQQSGGDLTGVKGTAGVDYPILDSIPTNLRFKCDIVDSPETRYPAYYADPYTRCQVFHVCQSNRAKDSFLCPNGTIFNQKVRVCDWWHNVECQESASFYSVNDDRDR